MNVTVKLQDSIYTSARHRAVDEGLSLSAWLAKLIAREVGTSDPTRQDNILQAIGDERLASWELEIKPARDLPGTVEW